jgi:DUF4097 and DUF4098 domain-containing protein YvlB
MILRNALAFALLAVSTSPAPSALQGDLEARYGPEVTEAFTRSVPFPKDGTLDLSSGGGDVVVTGGADGQLRIDAVKRVRHRRPESARAGLKSMTISVDDRAGRVEIRTEQPEQPGGMNAIDFTVTLPATANVIVRTVAGDLRFSNILGQLQASTVSGRIAATKVGGLRAIRTIQGDVEIVDGIGQDVSITAMSGNVSTANLKAVSINVDAQIGSISMTDATSERVSLTSRSGSIAYTGPLARGGGYRLQSFSGDVALTPLNDTGFSLEANSFNGMIRADVPFAEAPTDTVGDGGFNRTIYGNVGDGSATVELRSYSGNVTISRK